MFQAQDLGWQVTEKLGTGVASVPLTRGRLASAFVQLTLGIAVTTIRKAEGAFRLGRVAGLAVTLILFARTAVGAVDSTAFAYVCRYYCICRT